MDRRKMYSRPSSRDVQNKTPGAGFSASKHLLVCSCYSADETKACAARTFPPPTCAELSGENTTGEHCRLFSQEMGTRRRGGAEIKIQHRDTEGTEVDFARIRAQILSPRLRVSA